MISIHAVPFNEMLKVGIVLKNHLSYPKVGCICY
jgi:hypothetical protein